MEQSRNTKKDCQGGNVDRTRTVGQTIGLEKQSGALLVDKAEGRVLQLDGASLKDQEEGGTAGKPPFHIPGPMCRLMRAKKGALLPKEYPIAQKGQKGQKGALSHKRAAVPHGRMRDRSNGKERSQVCRCLHQRAPTAGSICSPLNGACW